MAATSWSGSEKRREPRPLQVKRRAPPIRASGRSRRSSIRRLRRSSSAVSASRTWNWTVWPTRTTSVMAIPPGVVGPDHVADEEVAALERLLVLVDHPADVQALLDPLLVLLGQVLEDLAEDLERGPAAQLADDVPLDLGDDHRPADRPAPLADDRPDRQRAVELDRHGAVVEDLAVEDEPVLARRRWLPLAIPPTTGMPGATSSSRLRNGSVGNVNGSPSRINDGRGVRSAASGRVRPARPRARASRRTAPRRTRAGAAGARSRAAAIAQRLRAAVPSTSRSSPTIDSPVQPRTCRPRPAAGHLARRSRPRASAWCIEAKTRARSAGSPPSRLGRAVDHLAQRGLGIPHGRERRDALHRSRPP